MSNDPFTSDMFGSSVLVAGLGLGVTAFGGFSPDASNDDDPDPLPPAPAPALPVVETPVRRVRHRANFYLDGDRSEEHTSELQSLMRISYAVFCLKKKNQNNHHAILAYKQHNKTLPQYE